MRAESAKPVLHMAINGSIADTFDTQCVKESPCIDEHVLKGTYENLINMRTLMFWHIGLKGQVKPDIMESDLDVDKFLGH